MRVFDRRRDRVRAGKPIGRCACRVTLAAVVSFAGCADQAATLERMFIGIRVRDDGAGGFTVRCRHTTKADRLLAQLPKVGRVPSIVLNYTDVSDQGLRSLGGVKGLETLSISDARGVTNDGLQHLVQLEGLADLTLVNTKVTDVGMAHLAKLSGLERLCVSGISDSGLRHLRGLTGLRRLELIRADITYAGVQHLLDMRQLTSLSLIACDISEPNVQDLRRGLPTCRTIVTPAPG